MYKPLVLLLLKLGLILGSPLPWVSAKTTFLTDLLVATNKNRGCTTILFYQDDKDFGDTIIHDIASSLKTTLPYLNWNSESLCNNKALLNTRLLTRNSRIAPCTFVIPMFARVDEEHLRELRVSMSPTFSRIARPESDFWLWITKGSPDLLDQLLLSPAFPARTKNKLGVDFSGGNQNGGSGDEINLRTVCFFCNGGEPTIVNYPLKDPKNFNYFPDYTLNLEGHLIKISCPGIIQMIQIDMDKKGGTANAKRGHWKFLFESYLIPKINFTYHLFLSSGTPQGGTGMKLPDGSWVGTVGDVMKGEADFGILTAHSSSRIKVVEYTESFLDFSCISFATSEGEKVLTGEKALLLPFHPTLWLSIIGSTILALIFLKGLDRCAVYLSLEEREGVTRRGMVNKNKKWGSDHQLIFILGSYLDQDSLMPQFNPVRIFVLFWIFFAVVLNTVYKTKMVSFLVFPFITHPPQTFRDLTFSSYDIGFVQTGNAAYLAFKASNDIVYSTLLKKVEILPSSKGLECLLRLINRKRYACIIFDTTLTMLEAKNLTDKETRKILVAPETTYNIWLGLIMEGGSIHKEKFNKAISWIRPFGLTAVWDRMDKYRTVRLPKLEWLKEKRKNPLYVNAEDDENEDVKNVVFSIEHVTGLFLTLLIGLSLSIIVMMCEAFKNRGVLGSVLKLDMGRID